MVRPKKVVASARQKEEDSSDASLMVQSRSRRTIKPNPKYNSKEIIPMKRHDSEDEDDDDHDPNQSTEDDEDFHDDGAKDSDAEDTPPAKKRGRPPTAAPRSEPQPQRKLQQIRAGLKEASMSTSKIMHQALTNASLEKKRKLDYDDADEPSSKRRPAVATPISTRGVRPQQQKMAASAGTMGKENASVLSTAAAKKKEEGLAAKITKNASPAGTPIRGSPVGGGINTRRAQSGTGSAAGTPSPKPSPGLVRAQGIIGKDTTTPNRSMIQVRRTTPMNSQTSPASAGASPTTVVQQKTLPKDRVLLNRSPVVRPRPAVPIASPATPGTRTVVQRTSVQGKNTPSPLATKAPAARILNALAPSTAATSPKPTLVSADAELEPVPGDANKTTVTTIEKRFVIRLQPENEIGAEAEKQGEGDAKASINLLQLRSDIRSLKMPTELWSYQMKLHAHRGKPDPALEVPDKPGYMVHSVVLNRLVPSTTSPKLLNGQKVDTRQFDRTVELLKNHYNVTIEGRPVRLLGAPTTVADKEDVETLLQIVNSLTRESAVVKGPQ